MLKKLDWVHPRMEELGMLLSDPAVAQDQEKWRALMREHSQLEPLDQAVSRYAALEEEKKQAQMLLDEPDMEQMAREELNQVERQLEQTEREIQLLLLPKDPNEGRNVVMEIRSGAGGEEAALFGAMLMRMYMRYAERHGYKTEMLEANMTELGGVKEAVFVISGEGAFSRLKYESGVHRVQRIPVTESNGTRQTSYCPKRRMWISGSIRMTCASTSTALPDTADSISTRRTARFASRTCRPASS